MYHSFPHAIRNRSVHPCLLLSSWNQILTKNRHHFSGLSLSLANTGHPATFDPRHIVRQRSRGCVFKQKTEEETCFQQITGSEHIIVFALIFLRDRAEKMTVVHGELHFYPLGISLRTPSSISTQVQIQKPKSWYQISIQFKSPQ